MPIMRIRYHFSIRAGARERREGMTQYVKNQIVCAINEATGYEVPECKIIDAAHRIEKIVDEAVVDALGKVERFGELLDAVGLKISSKNKE